MAALSKPEYDHARNIYQSAYNHLSAQPEDTRSAIKDIFESVEIVSKLIDNRITRLGSLEINKEIKNACLSAFSIQKHEEDYLKTMLKSLAEWVNAHHPYRHGQGVQEAHTPPKEFAVLSLSTGSAYLRFLIDIHQRKIAPNT